MINIEDITGYFPEHIRIARFKEYILKEYLQYKILEYLFKSEYADLLTCLGGTCLRIVHGSQRFSEDLDFDHKDLNEKKFFEITNYLVDCLKAGCEEIDFKLYSRDFHHLVFNPSDANKLFHFRKILESLDFRQD